MPVFNCLPTVIGSMPHTDPEEACSLVLRFLKDIPAWPQLPRRSFLENMCAQYSQGFPGVTLRDQGIYIDRSADLTGQLQELYAAYLAEDPSSYPIGPDYAAGLHALLGWKRLSPALVKGQVTGPITWGLTVTDQDGRAILHDDVLGDAVPRLLRLKAAWQERELRRIFHNTVIFVDEPYLSSYGASTSAGVLTSAEKIVAMLDEVFDGIAGVKGIHCCGNTDWSLLFRTRTDIINFDAYNFAPSLALYPDQVKKFLGKGGNIAWGIVPNEAEALSRESPASLKDRLEEAMAPFTRDGFPFRQLVAQGLLTPSCGLASLTEDAAALALEMLAELSRMIRSRYA